MMRQRVAIGLGLGTLLLIGASSTALDIKSRHDAEWVDHTLEVLQKTSDLRLLVREAEGAARGFALTNAASFRSQFSETSEKIPSAIAELRQDVDDNPDQLALLDATEALINRRLDVSAEFIRLHAAGDTEGMRALMTKAEGRAAMATISFNLDHFAAEEKQLLASRSATSRATGSLLVTVDLVGVTFLLLVAAFLIRRTYLADRQLRASLSRSEAEASSLAETAQKQDADLVAAHEKLRHSAEVLENTFNSMAEAVLVVDAADTVIFSNPAAERLLGYRPGKLLPDVRQQIRVFEADGTTPIAGSDLPTPRALRGDSFDRRELVVHRNDRHETFRLLVSGRPLRDGGGRITGAALVYHDVTASHETERLLQQAQKLDAIGKLTGGVAHDFNNMLTVIAGAIESLIEDLQDRPAAVETAELIGQAAERCTELIRHLLAFARKQPLHPRDSDVNSTVLDIAKLLRPTLGEQIEINTILEDGAMIAHIDSAQLANSLVNMAINARDVMPNGGKLLFETHKAVLDEGYARANPGVKPGPYIMVAVSDTGTGMPPEVQSRAFEPFFTTKEAGKGSGLGLSMVYGFAKQSGGHVKIYSEADRGTTIRLYLPPATGTVETTPVFESSLPRGTQTIFVVEDDRLVQDFVVAQLRSLGYKTITASNATEALTRLEDGPQFDLLLTDVIMPGGINGMELADEVARRRPGVKVLYTSGYTDNAMVQHGRLGKSALLLTKPYRKSELAQTVQLALRNAASAEIAMTQP